jgi:UDPglucose 6-dehydrogenase
MPPTERMRLVVFGAGYVGLVTGTGLSDLGNEVLFVDIDPHRIEQLVKGIVPIYEPGLADLMRRNIRGGRLRFAAQVQPPFHEADAYFIAVGTPPGPDGSADVSAVLAAADRIAELARKEAVVIVKSTVPVGTCDTVQARLAEGRVPLEAVSNPEFLKEGDAVQDFFKPDRIVVGARSERARGLMRELYAPLQLSGERIVITDPRSSELIKYAANTMLAMRISFMNELSRLCHATGADIHAVRLGVGSDGRIGKKFLYSGPGYGGSCFPKDVQALTALGKAHDVPMRVAEATHLANEEQAAFVARLVERAIDGAAGKTVAFWGLAFKPETDDVRESPAVKLAKHLLDRGAAIVGHDPEAGPNFSKALDGRVKVTDRDYDALDGAHALVLLTEWRSYRAPNFAEIRRRLAPLPNGLPPVVVDARNIWRPADPIKAGLRYQGIGVPSTPHPSPSSPILG